MKQKYSQFFLINISARVHTSK